LECNYSSVIVTLLVKFSQIAIFENMVDIDILKASRQFQWKVMYLHSTDIQDECIFIKRAHKTVGWMNNPLGEHIHIEEGIMESLLSFLKTDELLSPFKKKILKNMVSSVS
jgi:hypothetical protein